jgi:hypothetical protein
LPQIVTTYQPKSLILERVKGIEPSSSAWKAVALPLSYTRSLNFKGVDRQRAELRLADFAGILQPAAEIRLRRLCARAAASAMLYRAHR